MELKELALELEYRSGVNDVVEHFLVPCLDRAREYCRAVGYFSSSALNAVGRAVRSFGDRGGRIRLITSVELQAADIEAIQSGLGKRDVMERRLLAVVQDEFARELGYEGALLAALIATDRLEIRIALPTDGEGIYHEKVGVILDDTANYVAFAGSTNDSTTAFFENYECIDVFPSWLEPRRAALKRAHFERLWAGTAAGVATYPFPEAAAKELLRIAQSTIRGAGSGAIQRLWPHQEQAVEKFLEKKRGVLEMATGTGKTRTALAIARQLLLRRNIDTIIVAAEGTDLLDQWIENIHAFLPQIDRPLRILRHYDDHHDRDEYLLAPSGSVLVASRPALRPAMRALGEAASRTLLVHDEVHGLGSASNRTDLAGTSDRIPYRLGLSATPEREYDAQGTAFISEHIGPVIFAYELADAIRDGVLCEFDYVPLRYQMTDDDRARLQAVYKRKAARAREGLPMSEDELFTSLAKVHKTSEAKLPMFRDLIRKKPELLTRSIIFLEDREYGDKVLPLLHEQIYEFHTYYADDDKEHLLGFVRGDVSSLMTCHRLSQGIDIPSLRSVFLFSSNSSRLETIQRMGRCLRVDPGEPKKRATVVDFVREREPDDVGPTADERRASWLEVLAKTRRGR